MTPLHWFAALTLTGILGTIAALIWLPAALPAPILLGVGGCTLTVGESLWRQRRAAEGHQGSGGGSGNGVAE